MVLICYGCVLGYGQGQYVIHDFTAGPQRLNCAGVYDLPLGPTLPPAHGRQVNLVSHHPTETLPAAGIFDWHYLQCVLKKFTHMDYQGQDNIYHSTLPFRTYDDEVDTVSDDSANPPYPGYLLERTLSRDAQVLKTEERNRDIIAWSSGVSG